MFALGPATKVYVATGATDMRKGFDGLYGLVRDKLRVRSGDFIQAVIEEQPPQRGSPQ